MNNHAPQSFAWFQKLSGDIPSAVSGNDNLDIDIQDHLGLWKNELEKWMPESVFDAHIHLGSRAFMARDFSPQRLQIALSSFGHMTIEELDAIYAKLYPGRKITGMFAFPFPQMEIDANLANRYIIQLMKRDRREKESSHPTEIPDVIGYIQGGWKKKGSGFLAIKPIFGLAR